MNVKRSHSPWYVYVIVSDNTHYVGCTNDVERRLRQHNGELRGGAKFTRGRIWSLGTVYGPFPSRSKAQSAELRVKRYRGCKRLQVPELEIVSLQSPLTLGVLRPES
jgi:putative endonuclease